MLGDEHVYMLLRSTHSHVFVTCPAALSDVAQRKEVDWSENLSLRRQS